MDLNRREFLALTGSAVAVRLDARVEAPHPDGAIAVLHLDDQGHLRESVEGYQRALETLGIRPVAVSESSVVMAARRGATVIVETSASANAVLAGLGVHASEPIHLWRRAFRPADMSPATLPYISYTWPATVMVRDFSRVVPVSGTAWDPIAEVGGICVGVTRRTGRGRLIVLGSPLGPVLLGGDREAHEWLEAVLAYGGPDRP